MHKGSAADLTEIRLNAAELGALIGISERRVRELRDQKVLDSVSGQFSLVPNIAAYCALLRPVSGRKAAGGSDAALSLDTARIRLLTAQSEAQETKNRRERGRLVEIERVARDVEAAYRQVRDTLLALPSAHAARLIRHRNPAAMAAALEALIVEALEDLAFRGPPEDEPTIVRQAEDQ
jgi:phage terminase Nu1 subunit (DNA packaging protein)